MRYLPLLVALFFAAPSWADCPWSMVSPACTVQHSTGVNLEDFWSSHTIYTESTIPTCDSDVHGFTIYISNATDSTDCAAGTAGTVTAQCACDGVDTWEAMSGGGTHPIEAGDYASGSIVVADINSDDRTGSDSNLVTGTSPPAAAVCAEWNTEGDLIHSATNVKCGDGYAPIESPSFTGIVTLPVADDPTTDSEGEIAVDRDRWDTADAIEFFDGNASVNLVTVTTSDTPGETHILVWKEAQDTHFWEKIGVAFGNPAIIFGQLCVGETGALLTCGIDAWDIDASGNATFWGSVQTDLFDLPPDGIRTDYMTFGVAPRIPTYFHFLSDAGSVIFDSALDMSQLADYEPLLGANYGAFWTKNTNPPTPWFTEGDGDTKNQLAFLASPIFTGDPAAPTPAADDDDTSIATTAFVQTEIGAENHLGALLSSTGDEIVTSSGGGELEMYTTSGNENGIRWDFSVAKANRVEARPISKSGPTMTNIYFNNLSLVGNKALQFNHWVIDLDGVIAVDLDTIKDSYAFMAKDGDTHNQLPELTAGLATGVKFCVMKVDHAGVMELRPHANDFMSLRGTDGPVDESVFSSGAIGDYACVVSRDDDEGWNVYETGGYWTFETPPAPIIPAFAIVGGDTYWVGEGSGIPYGSMYNHDDTTTVDIVALDTPTQIPSGFSQGEVNETTFGNAREITVTKAGRYAITWQISFTTSSANQEIEGCVMIGGVADATITAHRKISTATDTGSMSATGILDLDASDVISLAVTNESSSTVDVNIEHANMTVTMVGGT